jgi:hypothetical protein
MTVVGEFNARGGTVGVVTASHEKRGAPNAGRGTKANGTHRRGRR